MRGAAPVEPLTRVLTGVAVAVAVAVDAVVVVKL
jgi:hypothetical protein